jgi:hypothetical protein
MNKLSGASISSKIAPYHHTPMSGLSLVQVVDGERYLGVVSGTTVVLDSVWSTRGDIDLVAVLANGRNVKEEFQDDAGIILEHVSARTFSPSRSIRSSFHAFLNPGANSTRRGGSPDTMVHFAGAKQNPSGVREVIEGNGALSYRFW